MDRYKKTFETWNKVASLYEDKFMNLDLYDESYDMICNSIKAEKANLLEIGCGPGNISKYLLSKRPDFNILGTDISLNMLELAKRNNPTANFLLLDARQIGALTAKYEGIICGFCLPYLSHSDSVTFIFDCYNLLKEDGLIYLSFVEGDPGKSGYQVGSSGDKVYFYFHRVSEITKQLSENHFTQIKIYSVNFERSQTSIEVHTIITAIKKKATVAAAAGTRNPYA